MNRTPSISLTDHQRAFVAELIASGRYTGVSDVMRDALRLLEEKEARRKAALDRLTTLVDEGLESGQPAPFDSFESVIAAKRGRPTDDAT